jgi:DNA-binding SARP family transcriptional activator
MLSVSLLGDFRLEHHEMPVTGVDTPRLQALLAYLLLHREAHQSRARLAFLFWPDTTEAQARTNLRNLLHHLRRALPDADTYLEASVQTLRWQAGAPLALDVADFDAALAQAEQATQITDWAAVQDALESAAALYEGDLLPSCYDDWIIPLRERLRQAYLRTLERLIRMLEEQRDYPAAIRNAQRLLRHDPLHEATYRRLMRLNALNGDRAAALRVYHTCTTVLQRELDVEPGAATREAYEQLLDLESRPFPALTTTTAASPLVGREREWKQMQRAWRTVVAGGEPHIMMLRGEAGIGKTRLAEELLQWAARQGIACASARCYAAEGELAYAPVTAWLRAHPLPPLEDVWLAEVARLLPEVLVGRPDLPPPVALTEAWQRQRLFEALSRAILGTSQPLLLTIDDLQWCGRDTLEWLHFLLRFDRGARLLVVGTYRPEEVGDSHPLASSLQTLRLEGQVTEVGLQSLDEAATHTLATQMVGKEIDTGSAQLLYRETEGNPLFVVESVRAGLPDHDRDSKASPAQRLPHASLPDGVSLPPKVQSVLEARLAQVSPPARELAALASTIGREFSFELLAEASGRDEHTLVGELDELWQRRIVRERGTHAYDFSHDKLRDVAYGSMSAARRRLLHRNIAQALETHHAADLDPVNQQLAAHYERAGVPAQAVPYYLRAAEVARLVYANEEAIALLRRGLALVDDGGPSAIGGKPSHLVSAQLYEGLGDVLELTAQHEEAHQAYHSARVQIPTSEQVRKARLYRKAGAVMREQRLYAEALTACNRAEEVLGEQPDAEDSLWWAEWLEVQVEKVWAHYWLAQWPEMAELVEKLQPVVQERGKPASRMRFLMASCLLHLRRDRYVVSDETLANSREALAASQEWGSLKVKIECQFELGFLHLWRRELVEAEEHLQAALELAEASGIVPMRTVILTYLTVLCRFRSQIEGVLDYALRAQEAAEAAQMPDYVAAAKGNQAWAAWREQNLLEVEEKYQEALLIWEQSPLVYPFQWQVLWPAIAVALARGRDEEAWAHAQALLEPTQQRLPEELNAVLEAAIQAFAEGQARVARPRLDRAMEMAREMGYL